MAPTDEDDSPDHLSEMQKSLLGQTETTIEDRMRTAVAVRLKVAIARPLKVLVPIIQEELNAGARAGLEHYAQAGDLLVEAREQVAPFKWTRWLKNNFALSQSTAYDYMALAIKAKEDPAIFQTSGKSLFSIVHPKAHAARKRWRGVEQAAARVEVDVFAEARQARTDEVQLHRDLALELIDIGFKALATRLHPDRGGSRDAMRRLNRVRDTLKHVAKTRRFD